MEKIFLNDLRENPKARKDRKRVGRGVGSGLGKTCGSGHKGQKSRTGVSINGFEGGQMPLHKRLPRRGFNNIFKKEFQTVNLDRISQFISRGVLNASAEITEDVLRKSGIVRSGYPIKILGRGKLTTAIKVKVYGVSKSAKTAIESLGGTVDGLSS
jgi:large subunit ribosomal protein L15